MESMEKIRGEIIGKLARGYCPDCEWYNGGRCENPRQHTPEEMAYGRLHPVGSADWCPDFFSRDQD